MESLLWTILSQQFLCYSCFLRFLILVFQSEHWEFSTQICHELLHLVPNRRTELEQKQHQLVLSLKSTAPSIKEVSLFQSFGSWAQLNGNPHKIFFFCRLFSLYRMPLSPFSWKVLAVSFKPKVSHHCRWEIILESLELTIFSPEQSCILLTFLMLVFITLYSDALFMAPGEL